MFGSIVYDRIKRDINKYYHGANINRQLLCKPLYICIISIISFSFCIYFAFIRIPNYIQHTPVPSKVAPSHMKVRALRDRFIEQLDYALTNPFKSTLDKIQIPENALFTRTRTVQYLYDYAEAATKHFFQSQYAADPNYHHLKCVDTFTYRTMSKLPQFEMSVTDFLRHQNALYSQQSIHSYTKRAKIKESNAGGLAPLVGQYGIVAKKDIAENTCIGHYYGDEYLN